MRVVDDGGEAGGEAGEVADAGEAVRRVESLGGTSLGGLASELPLESLLR